MKKHIRLTGAGHELTACGKLVNYVISIGDETSHMPYSILNMEQARKIFTCEECLKIWFEEESEQ